MCVTDMSRPANIRLGTFTEYRQRSGIWNGDGPLCATAMYPLLKKASGWWSSSTQPP